MVEQKTPRERARKQSNVVQKNDPAFQKALLAFAPATRLTLSGKRIRQDHRAAELAAA
jgi:hypothetical protein